MKYIIQLVFLADGRSSPLDGQYVVQADVNDINGNLGFGNVTATPDKTKAMTFDSPSDAMAYWQRVSNVMPVRPNDGKPNRPLTAFTVMVQRL